MSQIYIKEPPTNGKVLLKTTLGDMDIELWSKETPLACRNFVQLCLEGYYNGTMFHRIVPDFIAQCGDPTGTGEGGESVYGSTFKDEFHSRLKFNRRGLVGMANGGRDDNSSQFFITLNRTDELTSKHTLFGKITGDTLYNMIRLNEVQTDKEGRPHNPPKILKTRVLLNPFDDIQPRIDSRKLEKKVEKPKNHSRATKNFGLLSFGEEAEDDEEQVTIASKDLKIKSSHDVLTDDPKLSSEPALETLAQPSSEDKEKNRNKRKRKRQEDDNVAPDAGSSEEEKGEEEMEVDERAFDRRMKEQVKHDLGHVEDNWEDDLDEYEQRVARRTEILRQQSKQLKLEMKQAQRAREEEAKRREREERERENIPDAIKAMRQEHKEYRRKKDSLKGTDRERQTMDLLEKFKSQLVTARTLAPHGSPEEEGGTLAPDPGPPKGGGGTLAPDPAPPKEEGGGGTLAPDPGPPKEEGGDSAGDREAKPTTWFGHQLALNDAEDRIVLAKDANVKNEDTYDITDPRHPLNVRRRAEGEVQAPKKRRDRTRN